MVVQTLKGRPLEDLIENDYALIRDFAYNLPKTALDHLSSIVPIWVERKTSAEDWESGRQNDLDNAMDQRMAAMGGGVNAGLYGIFIDTDSDDQD